ncbi:jg23718 [Pararge aegeria aegeria]|uniref:Jg23718 protein n=1 Tax=Pararge aegeria aegeria TaxID=348720 RepID=A0A8S4QHQ9_9NEOP|nr:jg23718 [Pararge aegeria aegeria]
MKKTEPTQRRIVTEGARVLRHQVKAVLVSTVIASVGPEVERKFQRFHERSGSESMSGKEADLRVKQWRVHELRAAKEAEAVSAVFVRYRNNCEYSKKLYASQRPSVD